MKIGIYGGSFDPVHFGHLLLAESCLQQCGLDRVIFVPTGNAPHKSDSAATGEHRIEMINAAVAEYEQYSTSRYEIDSGAEVNYTVDTLQHFHDTLLDPELYLILGSDMFNDLPHWKNVQEILRLATPIVAARAGFSAPYFEALSQFVSPQRLESLHSYLVKMPLIELSSSQIRRNVAEGKSIRFQTPRIVENHIHTYGLYRRDVWHH